MGEERGVRGKDSDIDKAGVREGGLWLSKGWEVLNNYVVGIDCVCI